MSAISTAATTLSTRTARTTASPSRLEAWLGIDRLLTLSLLLGVFLFCLRKPIGDPDLGWHLAAGAHILDHGIIPRADTFSYVASGRAWFDYSWLAETGFAATARAFGAGALVVLAAALVTATFGLVLHACRRAGARHVVAVGVTALAAAVSAPTWTVRPHLFSFLFLAVTVSLLVTDRRRPAWAGTVAPPAHYWLLVPMMILWANTHVFFIYAFALLGIHALTHWRRWVWSPTAGLRRGALALLLVTGLAVLANPRGIHLLEHIVALTRETTTFAMVSELKTPSLHEVHGKLLTVFFFLTTLALVRSRVRRDADELVTFFLFAFLAYSMARNMPFFAIVAAPVLARHGEAALPAAPRVHSPPGTTTCALHATILAGLCAIVVAAVPRSAAHPANPTLDAKRYPVAAVAFLAAQPPLGRLFNHFNWGGFLIGTLYPRYQVSIDGRTGVYGEDNLRQYRATQYLEPTWRAFLERCDPDVVLWRPHEPFAQAIALLPEWRRLYEDDVAVIFVRDLEARSTRPDGDTHVRSGYRDPEDRAAAAALAAGVLGSCQSTMATTATTGTTTAGSAEPGPRGADAVACRPPIDSTSSASSVTNAPAPAQR